MPTFTHALVDGLPITHCRTAEVESICAAAIGGTTAPARIATVNLDFLRLAAHDQVLRRCLEGCTHLFADGWPVLALARLAGHALPERVTGSDLTPLILDWAARHGWRIALVGGRPGAAAAVSAAHPAVVCGHFEPDYRGGRSLRDADLAARIRGAGADIVLVALGGAKQELWIEANLEASGARVAMGVGASLDFMAGQVRRAPRLWRHLHAEFIWRALQEPGRLGPRYLLDAAYLATALPRAVLATAA